MSGLIYAVIVVMWAAFLVPMWLRRHDEAVEAKSVDRFSTAMKVLARRTSVADSEPFETADETPARSAHGLMARVRGSGLTRLRGVGTKRRLASLAAVIPSRRPARDRRIQRRPVSLAVRRRRVLVVLLGLTVLVAILRRLGVLPWPVVALAAVLLVAYVVHLRVQARRTADLARSRGRARAGATHLDASPSHTVKITRVPSRRHDERVAPSVASSTTPDSRTAAALGTADATGAAISAAAPDGFAGPRVAWDPVPVPSPTYVTAPRAPRAIRSIDLTTDGAWTSGRLVADAKAAAAAAVTPPSEREEDHAEARRAVGD